MAGDVGSLKTDPLFLGLTRPALIGGVTYSFFAMNLMICTLGFVMTSRFTIFAAGFVIHFFGMMLCKQEPLAVDMLINKMQRCPPVPNNAFHGGVNSYNMF